MMSDGRTHIFGRGGPQTGFPKFVPDPVHGVWADKRARITMDFMGHTYHHASEVGKVGLTITSFATRLQAVARGFLVRVREMNSMLVEKFRDAEWWVSVNQIGSQFVTQGLDRYPRLRYDNQSPRWKHMLKFNPIGVMDRGFFKGLSNKLLYPQLRKEGDRWVADFLSPGPNTREVKGIHHYRAGTRESTKSRWHERRVTMMDWIESRNRVGPKFLDFGRYTNSRGISKHNTKRRANNPIGWVAPE